MEMKKVIIEMIDRIPGGEKCGSWIPRFYRK